MLLMQRRNRVNKDKGKTADAMGGEERALMPYSVPSQDLWTFVLPITLYFLGSPVFSQNSM